MPVLRLLFNLTLLAGLPIVLGCQRSSVSVTGHPDPLLMTKSLTEGVASAEIPEPGSPSFPQPPRPPIQAWAVADMMPSDSRATLRPPMIFSASPTRETPPTHSTCEKHSEESRIKPASSVVVSEQQHFGHAIDYRWIRGVLEQISGRMLLRYSESSAVDVWGGSVCLEPNQRLRAFQVGDVLYVEGDFVRQNGNVQFGEWLPLPRYEVQRVLFLARTDVQ